MIFRKTAFFAIFTLLQAISMGNSHASETVLKAVTFAPISSFQDSMIVFKEYMKRVNERGAGVLRIDHIGSSEVIPIREQVASAGKGIVDMAVVFPAHASVVPEVHTVRLSKLDVKKERESGFIDLLDEAHAKMNVKVIGRTATQSGFHIFSNKPLKTLADFQGLKIRSHAGYDPFFKALGTQPIHMKLSEAYSALDRGLVDAVPQPIFVFDQGIHEVTRYALENSFWTANSTFTYINRKKFEALPDEARSILMGVQLELENEMEEMIAELIKKEKERLGNAGMQFIRLSDEEAAKWDEIALNSWWEAFSAKLEPQQANKIQSMILQ